MISPGRFVKTVLQPPTPTSSGTLSVASKPDTVALTGAAATDAGVFAVASKPDVVSFTGPPALTLAWLDRYGVGHVWPIGKLQGIMGLGPPPVQVLSLPLPAMHGEKRTSAKWMPRQVTIPFNLSADTEANIRTQLRQWAHWLDPSLGPGVLQVAGITGGVRQLFCRYVGGLELTSNYEHLVEEQIQLIADDPFFYDTTSTDGRVDNVAFAVGGDVPTWPIWSVKHTGGTQLAGGGTAISYGVTSTVGSQVVTVPASTPTFNVQSVVVDSRPATRGVWATSTQYSDPLAAYLGGATTFTQACDPILGGTSTSPLTILPPAFVQVPFDMYAGGSGVYTGLSAGQAKFSTVTTDGAGLTWHLGFYRAWLTQ